MGWNGRRVNKIKGWLDIGRVGGRVRQVIITSCRGGSVDKERRWGGTVGE